MGAGEIGVPCISYLILIDDNAMDTFEEFDILNQRREAIVAMIDRKHYAFRKLGMCRFRCSITIQLLELMRWATDLSVVLIEQYPRMSLEHYMMITTEITMIPSELFTGDSKCSCSTRDILYGRFVIVLIRCWTCDSSAIIPDLLIIFACKKCISRRIG
ncbi:hypothetical protein Tsp_11605 [Trichinella spiralis]|uniref:hypothetical protein n=1 Tax=Trichinella spiralis TaxID=6334 RepID=UPI0001EFE6FF|nr:hypothetical protein Tsp_11605 [Trichinella spiralis]